MMLCWLQVYIHVCQGVEVLCKCFVHICTLIKRQVVNRPALKEFEVKVVLDPKCKHCVDEL